METRFLIGEEGQPILMRRWRGDPGRRRGPRRAVFLGHSQPTHSGMLADLACAFRDRGWEAASGDIRGHGQSTGRRCPLGHLPLEGGWDQAVADLRLLLRETFEGVPWEDRLVVVPNITALMTLEVLKTWPDLARHIAFISPPPNQRSIALFGKAFSAVRVRMGYAEAPDEQSLHHLYAFLGAHLADRKHPADVISNDRAVVEAVLEDPQGWPMPTSAYWSNIFTGILSAWKWPRDARVREGTRCAILYGADDPMTRDGGFLPPMERLLTRIGMAEITPARIDGARTGLFLEERRLGVAARITDWVNHDWQPAPDHRETTLTDVLGQVLRGGTDAGAPKTPAELVEMCYHAIDDETYWTELMYRIMQEAEAEEETDEAAMIERVSRLMPHWERSFELNRQVMMSATLGVLLQSVVERLGIGVAILSTEGTLLHCNDTYAATLKDLFAGGGEPKALTGRLLGATPARAGGEAAVLHDGQPVGYHFSPAALRQTRLQRRGPASVLILRAPGQGDITADSRVALAGLAYGLTGKEAEVALMVADGRSPGEAAEVLGIGTGTVRGHLKKAFQKIEVHSQSELSARLLSGPLGWVRGGDPAPAPATEATESAAVSPVPSLW
ncbi:alpha/beta hydrolase [Ferrimonas balearica]|nr:alpha/beta hydrolase [Ferrimonas balearica]